MLAIKMFIMRTLSGVKITGPDGGFPHVWKIVVNIYIGLLINNFNHLM